MTFGQAVFLNLLYQEPEWYTADYVSRPYQGRMLSWFYGFWRRWLAFSS
jgi:hypothetical protein